MHLKKNNGQLLLLRIKIVYHKTCKLSIIYGCLAHQFELVLLPGETTCSFPPKALTTGYL